MQVDKVPYPAARVPVERCEVRQLEGEGEGGATMVRWGPGEVR